MGSVSEEFKELIHFLDTSEIKNYGSGLVNDLAKALEEARSNEKWRHDYMTWAQMLNEIRTEEREEGRLEGREEGRVEAREEGLCSMIKTVRLLVGDDFAKVCEIIRENEIYAQTSDEEIRKYWE